MEELSPDLPLPKMTSFLLCWLMKIKLITKQLVPETGESFKRGGDEKGMWLDRCLNLHKYDICYFV
eukprot:15337225-Ditylum_brightwellii.AAC.1